MFALSMRLVHRGGEGGSILGLAIMAVLANSVLHALALGMVTTLVEPRYGLPCTLTLEMALLFAIIALPDLLRTNAHESTGRSPYIKALRRISRHDRHRRTVAGRAD
jgi:hypothetical protein